jgi:hypothetical protein
MKKMAKVVMKLNGKVVGTAEHEDIDIAMNDAIRDYYVYKDHGLTHDELWDMIEDGAFEFETTY